MFRKLNTEHVEHFALQPVRGGKNTCSGTGPVSESNGALHAQPLIASEAIKDVDKFESGGTRRIVDSSQVHKELKFPLEKESLEDVTQGAEHYDVILDNVGTRPLLDFRRVMKPDGIFVIVGGGGPNDGKLIGPMARPLQGLLLAPFVSQQFVMLLADINDKDLQFISDMTVARKLTPVIDRTYTLSEVPAAIRYLEEGHARGKVIITVAADDHAS